MSIASPKRPPTHPDYNLDCQEALEPHIVALTDQLEQSAGTLLLAAHWIEAAAATIDADDFIARELRLLIAWAVVAGWDEQEVRRALPELAHNNRRRIEANNETDAAVRRAQNDNRR